MHGLFLALVLSLVACASPQKNLATSFVTSIEPDAHCTAYFTNAGPTHTHSAVCRLPERVTAYCTLSSDRGPACQALNGAPQQPQHASALNDPAARGVTAAPSSPPAPTEVPQLPPGVERVVKEKAEAAEKAKQ